jgi:hypothetical protein
MYLSNNIHYIHIPVTPSLLFFSYLSLPFHRIQSIRGLTHPASTTSQDSFQLIGMVHLLVCVKDDEQGLQLEPEGLKSCKTFPCLHFRNFNQKH